LTVDLGPGFTNTTIILPVRETPTDVRRRDVAVLMVHYQVASDLPGGATSNSTKSSDIAGRPRDAKAGERLLKDVEMTT